MGICESPKQKLENVPKGSISMSVPCYNSQNSPKGSISINVPYDNTQNTKKEPIKEEAMFPGHVDPLPLSKISIITDQMKKSICKIDKENFKGTGFLCLIPYPNRLRLLTVLITCNHVLNDLKIGNKIKLIFDRNEKIIIIDKFRKIYK